MKLDLFPDDIIDIIYRFKRYRQNQKCYSYDRRLFRRKKSKNNI